MERRQLLLFGAIFALLLALLGAAWFIFLRPGHAVLYENLREADAAEVVAVLDQNAIDYRLEDGGHTITVTEDEIGKARVLVAGSGAAMGGVVGFELFNESDMGLTEFAQKVNYQRALQGELARTIMGMDGVAFARVHLSLPERTLFRANQALPKAAVTIQTKNGTAPDAARVTGIQQLVASAVTDMPPREVAVLDHRGRLLSALPAAAEATDGPMDERAALEEYYRARTRGVAEKLLPGVPFDVRVLALMIEENAGKPAADDTNGTVAASNGQGNASQAPSPSGSAAAANARNFRLRIALRTEAELNAEDRELLRQGIVAAAALDSSRGDSLRFETGPLEFQAAVPGTASAGAALGEAPPPAPIARPSMFGTGLWSAGWLWAALGMLGVFGLIAVRSRSRLSEEERQNFADILGENLPMQEDRDAR